MAAAGRKKAAGEIKDVRAAVEALGGTLRAAVAGDTTITTTTKAVRDNRVRSAAMLVAWADALEPDDARKWRDLVRALAGRES